MNAPAHPSPVRRNGSSVALLRVIVVAAALWPVVFPPNPLSVVPPQVRLASGVLWLLCWVPALVYLMTPAERQPPIPFLPIIGVAHGLYYALQLAVGVDNANSVQTITLAPLDPRHDYDAPIRLALLAWTQLLLGYYVARRFLQPKPFQVPRNINIGALRKWGVRLLVLGIVFDVLRQGFPIPLILRGALNFAVTLGQFGMAILIVLNVRGMLPRFHRLVLIGGFAMMMLLAIGTGSVANGVFAALTALLAMWVGGRRVPTWAVVSGIVAMTVFVSLRGVVMDYRRIAWSTDEQLPVAQRSQVLLGILADRVDQEGVRGVVTHGWDVVSTRSANLDLFADVMRRTPADVPYWNGQTYLSLVGVAVPRVLWPNKPQKQLGQAFGHRYDYLGDWDQSTSINLPYFIEFYCNFGELGVILGMLLVGVIYAVLEQRLNTPRQSILVSMCGLVLLVPLLNIESDFSLIFGGLLLNGLTLWAVLTYISRTSRTPRSASPQIAPRGVLGGAGVARG